MEEKVQYFFLKYSGEELQGGRLDGFTQVQVSQNDTVLE